MLLILTPGSFEFFFKKMSQIGKSFSKGVKNVSVPWHGDQMPLTFRCFSFALSLLSCVSVFLVLNGLMDLAVWSLRLYNDCVLWNDVSYCFYFLLSLFEPSILWMWLKLTGWTSGSMCFKQNVVYLVDQELPGLRSRHPVIKNLVAETATDSRACIRISKMILR